MILDLLVLACVASLSRFRARDRGKRHRQTWKLDVQSHIDRRLR